MQLSLNINQICMTFGWAPQLYFSLFWQSQDTDISRYLYELRKAWFHMMCVERGGMQADRGIVRGWGVQQTPDYLQYLCTGPGLSPAAPISTTATTIPHLWFFSITPMFYTTYLFNSLNALRHCISHTYHSRVILLSSEGLMLPPTNGPRNLTLH